MKRRILLLVGFFVSIVNLAQATNYYFSSVSGDDSRTPQQASSPSTPWKTLDKLSAYNLSIKAGDSVLFKRGDTFFGTLTIKSYGVSGKNVYYGAYGNGANPVITGFVTLTKWTQHSGSIYYASVDAPNLNIVTMNGTAKAKGRWPNTGWLKVDSHVGNQSITSSGLTSGNNWSGGEIVIRKYRFVLDRHVISSQSGNTLNYTTSSVNGNNSAFSPVDKNGFFIQGHLATLDQQGEWYYDAAAKRLYMHFGGSSPSNFVVKAAAKDYNTFVTSTNFVKIENVDFEGANSKGLWLTSSTNILIQNCNFSNQGGSSIHANDVKWVTVKGGTVNTSFSNGINFEHNDHNCTVDGVSVYNSNMIPGTGRSGSGISDGISIAGDNATIVNNKVINSGFNGINFLGNNILVEKNYVDTFCTIKDDGGGIYTYVGSSNATFSNRKVRNNIVLNAIGAQAGTDAYSYEAHGKGAGIYLDEYVNNVEISGNTIANGDWSGIFMHNAHDCQITNNIIYNHRYQMHVSQYTAATRNMTQTGNQYISKLASQEVWYYRTYVSDRPSSMGTSNNNYFARPIDDNKTIHCDFYQSGGAGTQRYTLDQWKSNFALDAASKKSPITYKSNISDSMRFEYNASGSTKTVSLDAVYMDVKGSLYAGSLTLQPYTSVVLLKSSSTISKQNQTITFNSIAGKTLSSTAFALTATASSGLPVSYRVASGPATISGNMVTLTGLGTVTIEASQAGNTTYYAASPVQQSFSVLAATVVTKQNQTISFSSIADHTYGDAPFTISATASSGLPVSYRVTSGPATISGNTVTLTGTGTVTIEASQAGNTTYNAATTVSRSFNVVSTSRGGVTEQTISFGTLAYKTYGAAPFTVSATASSGLPVSFRVVSGPASVSGSTVTVTGVGSVTIEASQAGNSTYSAATPVLRSFTVGKASQTISFPTPANQLYGAASFALTATASSGLAVNYRVVSGPATVSGNKVTLTGTGTVTIEGSQPGNTNYNAAYSLQRSFTVTAPTVTSVGIADVRTMSDAVSIAATTVGVYPNPVVNSASISITAAQAFTGTVDIIDMQGRLVQRFSTRAFEKGQTMNLSLDASKFVSGVYVVRLTSETGTVSKQFQVVK